ncbi:hypothetical protein E1263_27550 [Kribbella antibiotica]|uniref:Uncharacterized protein n=1 Tax=Kribbella antibiotica TaxID=190195 RepID=A0A4R4ZC24_9ACTN|nr:hypothetical protein [Kribbella antibiotica]TDD53852.1 hypothetical protein E1263_27550 [Kribbella antibiotica]
MSNKRQREIRAYQQLSGLNYTGAARELDRCADPRPANVGVEASALLHLIEPTLQAPASAIRSAEDGRALYLSANELRSIAGAAVIGSIHWNEYASAIRVSEWILNLGYPSVGLTTAATVKLVDTIRAVRRETCQLGHSRVTPCSPAPQRAIVNLGGQQHQGCFQHIAESILQQQHSESPTYFTLDSPTPVAEMVDQLTASGSITLPEDIYLDLDWGEALSTLPGLELEYDLAQHTPECAEAAIAEVYALGHDNPDGIGQVAAQVLEDSPDTCICPISVDS